jgi:hypothetical protein
MVIGRPVTWAAAGGDTNALSSSVHAAIAGRRQRNNGAGVAAWRDGIRFSYTNDPICAARFMGAPHFT